MQVNATSLHRHSNAIKAPLWISGSAWQGHQDVIYMSIWQPHIVFWGNRSNRAIGEKKRKGDPPTHAPSPRGFAFGKPSR